MAQVTEDDRLIHLMEENRKANENRPELTLDEINAEIAAVRAERKAKMEMSHL